MVSVTAGIPSNLKCWYSVKWLRFFRLNKGRTPPSFPLRKVYCRTEAGTLDIVRLLPYLSFLHFYVYFGWDWFVEVQWLWGLVLLRDTYPTDGFPLNYIQNPKILSQDLPILYVALIPPHPWLRGPTIGWNPVFNNKFLAVCCIRKTMCFDSFRAVSNFEPELSFTRDADWLLLG